MKTNINKKETVTHIDMSINLETEKEIIIFKELLSLSEAYINRSDIDQRPHYTDVFKMIQQLKEKIE